MAAKHNGDMRAGAAARKMGRRVEVMIVFVLRKVIGSSHTGD